MGDYGSRIKAAREASGLTQEQLGEKIGVTGVTIMRYEKNQREPRRRQLQRIAAALGVSYWDLIPDPGPNDEEDPAIMEEILKDFPYQTELGPASGEDLDKAILYRIKKSFPSEEAFYKAFAAGEIEPALLESKLDKRLIAAYMKLNQSGQRKATDAVEIIAGNPLYQAPLPSPEGKDTTAAEPPTEGG